MITLDTIVTSLTEDFDLANAAFRKMPSATAWKALQRSMLAYQQVKHLEGSSAMAAERQKVLVLCDDTLDSGAWAELVVGVCTGRSLDQWTANLLDA